MTCIVGLVDNGTVYIGADSAGSDGWSMVNRSDSKVFVNRDFVMGFTTSFRMGQLLRYAFIPPDCPASQTPMSYMVTLFIDELRKCLKDHGFASKKDEVEKGGTFLVGWRGELFKIENDYQVSQNADLYDSCGCGERFAMGALYATVGRPPYDRVMTALMAAEKHSTGVREPFHILKDRP